MACCGQRRARAVAATGARPPAVRPANAPLSAVAPRPAIAPSPGPEQPPRPTGGALIRYLDRPPVQILGPRTGRTYRFSAVAPLQLVATPDLPALLAMRQFRRA